MTVHKLTAGDGYTYLTRQVAANDATDRGFDRLGDYYSAKGEAPGVWIGSGLVNVPEFEPSAGVSEAQMASLFGEGRHPNAAQLDRLQPFDRRRSQLGAPYRTFDEPNEFRRRAAGAYRGHNVEHGLPGHTPVPADERARIRSVLAHDMFTEVYGRPPVDARELSGHLARISRQRTTAVAGYDLTFSPVKSVSTLWAVASRDVAQIIERAHHDAVRDTISWVEANATYTRRGENGIRQVDVYGLLAASFTHRDSRAGDPDLHTHVAISNKVQAVEDGAWLALDGRAIYKNGVAASERYNTRLEALLIDRLGVRFADRAGDDPAKRPVREIVGIDGELPRLWSKRRAIIDARRAELSAEFQLNHGRPPASAEAIALAQQANLETREAKHEPRSYVEQRAAWRSEALRVLGDEHGLAAYVDHALQHRADRRRHARPTPAWVEEAADNVLSIVQRSRATWQANHVRAEAERYARAADVAVSYLDSAVSAVVTAALGPDRSIPLISGEDAPAHHLPTPPRLLRRDGSSVYSVAGSGLYTSSDMLAAEETIISAAGRRGGRVVHPADLEGALQTATCDGAPLNAGQERLVRELATSGMRVQLALAPAGTGKTTAMRALGRAWTSSGGRVVGLAPSAAAAAVLREELARSEAHADTLAKLVHAITFGRDVPDWFAAIGADTLVVIDEAGMAGTVELATAIHHVTERGGSVRLIGDDRQLAAVAAGGVLRDIAVRHGAVTLSHVVRFTDAATGEPNYAEGAASLALRDGDLAAIAFYTDHRRIHIGDLATAAADAFAAWSTDRDAGRDAVMLAPTRELVTELNARARRDRLASLTRPVLHEVKLTDGSHVSAGDTIITRKNNRGLAITATDWVKNGDRWIVEAAEDCGALTVKHRRTGRRVTLPTDYVSKNVTLGYATTIHGAQGITADASYTVATGDESRQLLYVALTRGRHTNHVFLATAGDGDTHSAITRDALLPPTAVDILSRVLARDSSPVSATSTCHATVDPATRLGTATDQYIDALGIAAASHLGPERLAAIDALVEAAFPGATDLDAYAALRAHLAFRQLQGHSPADDLSDAIDAGANRGLNDARDVAAVLTWRLGASGQRGAHVGPLPWLPDTPAALRDDREWGCYLTHNAATIESLADRVAGDARAWTAADAPAWAIPFLHDTPNDTELVADLAVWRAAHRVDPGDKSATGRPQPAPTSARAQRQLERRVQRVLEPSRAKSERWSDLVAGYDKRIATDPYWPTLAERLAAAQQAGVDVTALVRRAVAERPLPDEQPAAALWWRLSPCIDVPDVNSLRAHTSPSTAVSVRADVPGANLAPRVQNDRARPHLIDTPADGRPRSGHEPVARERLVELNKQAANFYAALVDASWVPGYLTKRFGDELAGRLLNESRFTIGYAPAGWTNLTSHLRDRGASEGEIVASGLGVYASTGRVIDRFRDRLVTPVVGRSEQGEPEIRGWLGRRNPHPIDLTAAGPKYLNTPETVLFEKSRELFGLNENRDLLDVGAAPVLVEGPLDALAVTLVGGGHYVGVSVMGASLTDAQADLLRQYCEQGRRAIIVATDADPAGQRAARSAFWQLARRGADPQHLELADSKDPAESAERDDGIELVAALENTKALADAVIRSSVAPWNGQLHTVEGAVLSARAAISVIVALPPKTWPARIAEVVTSTGVARQTATEELLRAMSLWSANSEAAAKRYTYGTSSDQTHGDSPEHRDGLQTSVTRKTRHADEVRECTAVTRRSPELNAPAKTIRSR